MVCFCRRIEASCNVALPETKFPKLGSMMTAQGVRDDMTKIVKRIYLESNPYHEIRNWSKVDNLFFSKHIDLGATITKSETDSK